MKTLKYAMLLLSLCALVVPVMAQTTTKNLASPYYQVRSDDHYGSWTLYNPAIDTMDATPTDDTLYYRWNGLRLNERFLLYGVVEVDTTAGNLGAEAGTITVQQSPCPASGSGNCEIWTTVDTDNLPAEGSTVTLSGTVEGQRLRVMIIATAGNFKPKLRLRLTRD